MFSHCLKFCYSSYLKFRHLQRVVFPLSYLATQSPGSLLDTDIVEIVLHGQSEK
jgi:hypothetical protein